MLCVKNGMIHDGIHPEAFRGDILVEDGKIKAIGENLEAGEETEIVDAQGLCVYPGFVEAHGHIGLDGYGIGYEGMDYNEMNDIVTPHLRGIDGVKPMDAAFPHAAAAGDDISKKPAFDMKLEALIPVIKGEIPLKAHAHATEDIFAALRIAREFGVKITLEHVTEGHLIAEELAKENVPLAVGPTLTSASKFELRNKSWTTPGVLAAAGCQVSIITDSPVIPQEYLPLCAGLAVQAGMDPFAALQAITINPAKHAGIADRVGSLEVGKDADLVITDGCPFEVSTQVKCVLIDGKKVG